ncbi:hypothetical protein FE783_28295 [Paenibacillus mesophilus]|uniref:hypothetical protein n=1 Tax=Paenibacillus mesophilus TaxID=2582849 RepID=UPI00110E6482|nr:hypothetical protein [Paenibacillus mesophilus]TMV45833.1 hypothetical protein FE783_28295 [Paenibacillus mesophilus]
MKGSRKKLMLVGLLSAALTLSAAGVTGAESTGNGAPSGAHYNLNIIGVSHDKNADMTNNDGRRIFVPLEGSSRILLSQGDYQVLDANGTDGSAAFRLPNPDPDGDGTTSYSVYARALGKSGGSSEMTTCATDPSTDELYCSLYSLVSVRDKGKSSFDNVTKELLYIYVDLDGDGVTERYPLFDDRLENYFWQYDNKGLKVLQLRFYEQPTKVPAQ